jgi:hypothetical protein
MHNITIDINGSVIATIRTSKDAATEATITMGTGEVATTTATATMVAHLIFAKQP